MKIDMDELASDILCLSIQVRHKPLMQHMHKGIVNMRICSLKELPIVKHSVYKSKRDKHVKE